MILLLIIIILFGIYNGLIIQWYNNKNKKLANYYRILWHIIGWVIRLLIIISLPLKYIPLGIFLSWSCYNYIINIILNQPIFYIGTTVIDKYINKYIQIIVDILLLIFSIIVICL